MYTKVKVAVIGYGHLGKWHAQKVEILKNSELVAIVDTSSESRQRAKEAHPGIIITDDLSSIMDKINAAIIVTPTSSHFDLVKYLLTNSKHVFCEKPLTETFAQAGEIVQMLYKHEVVLQVGHSERFHEIFERLDDYSAFFNHSGMIVMNRIAPFKGRATDVDVVQDLMIHDLDLLMHLFKEVPNRVSSIGFKIRTQKWDHVTSTFEFSSGRKAFLTVGRNYVKEVRSLEVTNKFGTLYIDLMNNEILLASENTTNTKDYVKKNSYEKRDHLLIEQQHFYRSIIDMKHPIVDARAGRNVIKLLDKVTQSLETGDAIRID
ncbi:MAG: Gfo/Idh/MocA family oxidoreductase [Bacteriovoracaceae bacterium]|nr:Gfo/Idh/MocA family oxidoreductase [Bacteriovoracaceae bacterium]